MRVMVKHSLTVRARGITEGQRRECDATNLIVDFLGRIGKRHVLLEAVPDLLQLLGLLPVVEGARHVDVGSGMLPRQSGISKRSEALLS